MGVWSTKASGVPRNFFRVGFTPGIFFFGGGVQQIQLRPEGRENGDLGALAPQSGVPLNLQMSESHILIRLLRIFSTELGIRNSFVKTLEFQGGGFEPPPSVRH
jgi:hypothetical protein